MDRPTRLRLLQEKQDLGYKYRVLTEYITNDERYKKLDKEEQLLIQRQHRTMGEYLDVLEKRLDLPDA